MNFPALSLHWYPLVTIYRWIFCDFSTIFHHFPPFHSPFVPHAPSPAAASASSPCRQSWRHAAPEPSSTRWDPLENSQRFIVWWSIPFHMKNGDFPSIFINIYPLVICHITMERSTIFHGKIHYKWWFSIARLNYQRVYLNQWRFRANDQHF